eukprot:TRINITY_DN28732_c0_g1_i1.p2 TRINITY_DN28732_c0_g1~~TRINITY_DN28732_c0_g1_i1.p2  ORF type:complete len:316 (+),score=109.02 TRINITY_DN28732_c0_g1_i1:27-950(+)
MPFVKVVKNKAYFKRFQVKFRRRREGKTDYRARKRLVAQAKNKYNSHRYRLVARFTGRDIVAQVIYSEIDHDVVICAAYAHELPKYGLKVGLTNYAAAYCTGLLCARRLLKKYHLDAQYEGVAEATGKYFKSKVTEGRKPFKVLLDVGIRTTTTGAKVFAVLKGALDGGLSVPHSVRRFVGFKDGKYQADMHRHYIYGGHVTDYMEYLQEEGDGAYEKQFPKFIREGVNADNYEDIIKATHAAIRANPEAQNTNKLSKEEGIKKAATVQLKKKNKLDSKARKLKAKQKYLYHMHLYNKYMETQEDEE